MRIHYLQHISFEGPAEIADWAAAKGHEFTGTHLYRHEPLPCLGDLDCLIVMGGPMSVNDTEDYPWLQPEIELIAAAITAGKLVFGICLGAQLIARSLGAIVAPAAEREIGWFPVTKASLESEAIFNGLPATFTPLHWHGDAAELPAAAHCLAFTRVCPVQAFQYGANVIGLQFHLEVTPRSVAELVANAGHEIGTGDFQQLPAQILNCVSHYEANKAILARVLNFLETKI